MGRGSRGELLAAQTATLDMATMRERASSVDDLFDMLLDTGNMRAVAAKSPDIEELESLSWAERRQRNDEFIDEMVADLAKAGADFAASSDSWRAYLQAYANTPSYSLFNNLWARAQLRTKRNGASVSGMMLSESAWKALGREIRPDLRPPKRDEDHDWSSREMALMYKPLGFHKFPKRDGQGNIVYQRDRSGQLVLGDDGQPKPVFINGKPKGYGTFYVFHENATQAPGGGEPEPLPTPPWQRFGDSDEAPEGLIEDLTRVATAHQISFAAEAQGVAHLDGNGIVREQNQAASFDADNQTITLNTDYPPAEQARAALLELCTQLGDVQPRRDEPEHEVRLRDQAAAQSAAYVIGTLYGMANEEQDFAAVRHFSADPDRMRGISADIHQRVGRVLNILDPHREMQAEARKAYQAKRAERKRDRAKRQRSQRTRSAKAAA